MLNINLRAALIYCLHSPARHVRSEFALSFAAMFSGLTLAACVQREMPLAVVSRASWHAGMVTTALIVPLQASEGKRRWF